MAAAFGTLSADTDQRALGSESVHSAWRPLLKTSEGRIWAADTVWVPEGNCIPSRRYRTFLEYVVERTLDGHSAEIKERSLGVEIFDRAPDYETTSHPVVRITAGEVRKRLAQYYDNETCKGEIRIALPAGSYVPECRHVEEEPSTEPFRAARVNIEPAQPLSTPFTPATRTIIKGVNPKILPAVQSSRLLYRNKTTGIRKDAL